MSKMMKICKKKKKIHETFFLLFIKLKIHYYTLNLYMLVFRPMFAFIAKKT